MGTRGLYAFIYKGKCYVFYNQMDSYPEALGQILVTMIKTDDYKKWGEILVDKIQNKNFKIRKLKTEFGKYVEYVMDENEDKNLKSQMDEEEWFKNTFDGKNSYIYVKWNFYDLIIQNEIIKPMIRSVCPTLNTSSFVTSFDVKDNTYIEEILKLNTGDWIYIIDLDTRVFQIPLYEPNDVLTFELNNIPVNWLDKFKENLQ